MAGRISFDFELGPSRARKPARPNAESAMRILVLGDFSGRAQRSAEDHSDLASRKPALIDVDNFDRVMARIAPRLQLRVGGDSITLEFATIDDFHPDTLYRRAPLFKGLREMRQRMQNRATFAEAAEEFRSKAQRRIESATNAKEEASTRGDELDADTFARLLGGTPSAVPQRPHGGDAQMYLNALIREVVEPHIVPDAPHQALYLAAVDEVIAEQMCAIVQDRHFQALEALWRGVHWLASNLETNEDLKVYLLDVSQAKLLADIKGAQAKLGSSALYRLLVEQGRGTTGGEPWSLMVGNYAFGLAREDVELLAYVGAVASQAGGPFLAAAKPELIGCQSIIATPDPRDWTPLAQDAAERWNALRESPIAPWIGLALPRMLLRLPYGKSSDPVESFAFEELEPLREHESYLWGNGALACALLIGRAFASRGWDMDLKDELDVDDLPAHTYDDEGEKRLLACAEVTLVDRASQTILDAGLIPLLSHKSRNAVRVMRFQSIAKPAQTLNGPWG